MATYNVDKFTYNSNTYNFVDNTSGYVKTSSSAASGGTTLSLVTTGEKYTWNNKSSLTIGTTSTTAAAGNHTHTTTLATDTGTSSLTLASAGKYKLTAGGSSVIFTMPTIPAATTVTQTLTTGVEIGKVNNTTLYAPAGGSGGTGSVTQTNTTTGSAYRVLFSNSENDTTESSAIVRKNANLLFNPTDGTLTARIDTPNAGGYTMDQYGNLQCKMETPSTTSCWNLKDYAGTAFFKIYWNSKNVQTTGAFVGSNIDETYLKLNQTGASSTNIQVGSESTSTQYYSNMGSQYLWLHDKTTPNHTALSANSLYIAMDTGSSTSATAYSRLTQTQLIFRASSTNHTLVAADIDKIHNIGTVVQNSGTTNLSSSTSSTTLATFSLAKGTWIVTGNIHYDSGDTDGYRLLDISPSSASNLTNWSSYDLTTFHRASTTTTILQVASTVIVSASSCSFNFRGRQNSGSSLETLWAYKAIRIA